VRPDEEYREWFSARVRERGDVYFTDGRVKLLPSYSIRAVRAVVRGSRNYHVEADLEAEPPTFSCECIWFTEYGEECKHIWAVLRAVAVRVPAWKRFFDALGSAPEPRPALRASSQVDDILYVLLRTHTALGGVTIQVLSRSRRKNGDWTKWRPFNGTLDQLETLPPFDRETMAMLNARSYGVLESMITLQQPAAAMWIERLARAGKLAAERDGDYERIAWDEGPPSSAMKSAAPTSWRDRSAAATRSCRSTA